MSITNMIGKPLKHYAIHRTTNERYIMLALENETDPTTCSVIDMDKLDADLRSELREIIDSDACQREIDTWRFLDTKFFMNYPKQTILSVLRALRVIKTPKSDDVHILLPGDVRKTPKEVMESIRLYRKKEIERKTGIISEESGSSKSHVETEEVNKLKSDVETLALELSNVKETLESKIDKLLNLVEAMQQPLETLPKTKKK
jgi:hypothetical protein